MAAASPFFGHTVVKKGDIAMIAPTRNIERHSVR